MHSVTNLKSLMQIWKKTHFSNLFATSEPPKYLNSPKKFNEILFLFVFCLIFFEVRSKEFIDGTADWFDNSPYFWSSKKNKKKNQNFVKKREFRKSRIFGGSDATNMLYITYYWANYSI